MKALAIILAAPAIVTYAVARAVVDVVRLARKEARYQAEAKAHARQHKIDASTELARQRQRLADERRMWWMN